MALADVTPTRQEREDRLRVAVITAGNGTKPGCRRPYSQSRRSDERPQNAYARGLLGGVHDLLLYVFGGGDHLINPAACFVSAQIGARRDQLSEIVTIFIGYAIACHT